MLQHCRMEMVPKEIILQCTILLRLLKQSHPYGVTILPQQSCNISCGCTLCLQDRVTTLAGQFQLVASKCYLIAVNRIFNVDS